MFLLHLSVAQEAARGDDGGLGAVVHDLAVNLGLNAHGLAVFHEDGVDGSAEGHRATVGLDVSDDGFGAVGGAGVDEVAAAEAHAVRIAPQTHGDSQVHHAVDSRSGTSQDVLEQLGVDGAVGEAVHVLEHVVEGDPLTLLLLQLGLAGVGAAALGPVGHDGADALFEQAHLEALFSEVVGGHEAGDAGACDDDVALDGLVGRLLGGAGRGAVAVVGDGCGLVGVSGAGECGGAGCDSGCAGCDSGCAGNERATVERREGGRCLMVGVHDGPPWKYAFTRAGLCASLAEEDHSRAPTTPCRIKRRLFAITRHVT